MPPRPTSRHTVRAVRTAFARVDQARAQLASAEVTRAQAESDLKRRESAGKAVSFEELAHARDGVAAARAAVQAAEATSPRRWPPCRAPTSRTIPTCSPRRRGCARRRSNCARMEHPRAGRRHRRATQRAGRPARRRRHAADGDRAARHGVWVDANFKEVQLADMRVGQPATLIADVYGTERHVPRHGRRPRRGHRQRLRAAAARRTPPATGSRSCSACRCASRSIPQELAEHPLRVGLSMRRRRRHPTTSRAR